MVLLHPRPVPAEDIPCVWTGVEKIVAIGDLHGDYDNFVRILQGTRMVNEKLAWTGGKAHLVQTGDVMDRGPDAKAIFDLIRRLEKQALKKGGMVHFLLGNHEELNITGLALDYPGYITPEQFVSFLPASFRAAKEQEFRSVIPADPTGGTEERLHKFWETVMKDEMGRKAYLAGFYDSTVGWLLEQNAVIRINDTIFVHGGIDDKYSRMRLEDINALVRTELGVYRDRYKDPSSHPEMTEFKIVFDPNGPLWFRGLAMRDDSSIRSEFDRIMASLGAERMVIAHSFFRKNGQSLVVAPQYISRFDEKLWVIDTGISRYYGGVNSALIIERGDFILWTDVEAEGPVEWTGPEETPREDAPGDDEDFLKTAKVGTIIRGAMMGRTDPWTILLVDGESSRKAVFKYIDRRRPTPIPHSYKYELAAQALDRLLGLDLIPATVEREIEGVTGALQIYAEGAVTESDRRRTGPQPPEAGRLLEAFDLIKIFALLVNDPCENFDDTLVVPGTWRVYRVDFSEAFGPSPGLRPGCAPARVPEGIVEKLRGLGDDVLAREMSSFLNNDEIKALVARKSRLIELLAGLEKPPR